MAATLERQRDLVGGGLIVAIGLGFLAFGRELEFGTARSMGPGYFPTLLSFLMMALGAAMILLAWRRPAEIEGAFGHLPWRGLVLVIGPTVLFGLTLRGLGLAPILVLVVVATAWASRYAAWRTAVPLALGIAAFCSFLFIKALGLPLPLVGSWLRLPQPAPAATAPAPAGQPASPASPAPQP